MDAWELLQVNIQFYQSVMGQAEEALNTLDLEVKSFFLLAAVEEYKFPAELAKHCMMPKPTVTFMIKKLEKSGFLKRTLVQGDLRKFELKVTAQGKQTLAKGQAIVTKAFEKSLSKLTDKERQNYINLLMKMQVRREHE